MVNNGDWLVAATVGKMDNSFSFTPMVFDPDVTPEGGALTGNYNINSKHSIAFTGAAFVLDEEKSLTRDPFMYGGQVIWNAKWSPKWSSSVGVGALAISGKEMLTSGNVGQNNQGNLRKLSSKTGFIELVNDYTPLIADASVTYTLDSFPLYPGKFPVKLAAEYINNPGANKDNNGYWVGATLGKSGKKHAWDVTYRYEYLEADAMYDQMVDDDNGAYYQNAPVGGSAGFSAGTNIKGHLIKFNYSLTHSLEFSTTCFLNELIDTTVYSNAKEPNSASVHFMADLMWKF